MSKTRDPRNCERCLRLCYDHKRIVFTTDGRVLIDKIVCLACTYVVEAAAQQGAEPTR